MASKVRALLSLVVVSFAMTFVGCGHYTCGTTFGNATCSGTGSGISQGGNGNGSGLIAFGYFDDFSQHGTPSVGMALQVLDQANGSFLTNTSFVPPVTPPFPTGIVIVGKQFMYIPSSDGNLYSFSIDSATGNITSIGTSPTAIVGGNSIAASPSGGFIFVGDTLGQQISAFAVNTDGTLTAAAANPFPTSGVSPRVMATDGQSKFLYATAGPGSTQIAAFSIGTGGALTAVSGGIIASNVSAIAGEPTGKFLLGVDWSNTDKNVHVFSIGSTGALTELTPAATSGTPRNLAVHPSGAFVYTFDEDSILNAIEPVEGFDLNTTNGSLTPISGSPFLDILANGGAIEQTGQFLIGLGITQQVKGSVSTATPYSIDPKTGALAIWPPNTDSSEGFPGIDGAAYAFTDAK